MSWSLVQVVCKYRKTRGWRKWQSANAERSGELNRVTCDLLRQLTTSKVNELQMVITWLRDASNWHKCELVARRPNYDYMTIKVLQELDFLSMFISTTRTSLSQLQMLIEQVVRQGLSVKCCYLWHKWVQKNNQDKWHLTSDKWHLTQVGKHRLKRFECDMVNINYRF